LWTVNKGAGVEKSACPKCLVEYFAETRGDHMPYM
jgi:hypothetical protein